MRKIAVIGLGYVGLPVALAFGRRFAGVIGFDSDAAKLARLAAGEDPTMSVGKQELRAAKLRWSGDQADLSGADLFIIAVPTPIDEQRRPELSALRAAASCVGGALKPGDIVVLESTGYPGLTEDFFGPLLEQASGLRAGSDFALGYSPERINPGDAEHGLEQVIKVIAAGDAQTLEIMAELYAAVVPAGLHRAPSIRVAEAAKVIENIQRDLNIALVNELSMLFDELGLDTKSVLEAARTKWNFQAYQPGLVGGHCIGVDPYYLTSKAQSVGFTPEVILAGRRTNDGMADFIAARVLKLVIQAGLALDAARVLVLGLTFKPDVRDLRGSHVPRVILALQRAGLRVELHDPLAPAQEARDEHGLELMARGELGRPDVLLLAVPHTELLPLAEAKAREGCALVVDLMWALDPDALPPGTLYWRP